MPNASPTLASKLVLSDNASVEAVLTEIPFFTVGVVAFLLSTFFLFMRRFNLLALYLYFSAFLAFGAVTLDLSQVLARSNVSGAIDKNGLNGIVNSREVGLSLALGFRFLFYWTYVSRRPRGEAAFARQGMALNSTVQSHSGDWRRWGYVGFFLQWSLLGLVISIPVLETVWRISSRHFNTVYMASTTVAIVAAALFILKIFLNVFLSPVSARQLSRWYSVPVTALLINMGISIGNLISFAFSETTLGRFLSSLELYLLMLFLLISTFYQKPNSDMLHASLTQLNKMPLFDEKKTSEPGDKPQSKSGVIVGTPPRPFNLRVSRTSSWLFGRVPTRRSVSQGWGRGDIELGGGSTVSAPDDTSEIKFATAVKKSTEGGASELPLMIASPSMKAVPPPRPVTEVTLASYYEMDQDNRLSFPSAVKTTDASRNGSDSPVYGLNGIIRPSSLRSSKQLSLQGRASMSSFDELLRQQGELDKSIAALRLFSPQSSDALLIPKAPSPPASKPQPSRVVSNSTSSWAGRGLDSASARSEFSLSVFPEPPTTGEPVPILDKEDRTDGVRVTVDEFPSMPTSPHQYNTGRFASNGTQYDVTSFIGDLTVTPIEEQADRMNSLKRIDEARMQDVPSLTSATTLGPATASSGLLTGVSSPGNIQRRTSTVPAVSSPLANPFPPRNPMTVPVGPRPAMNRGGNSSMTRPGAKLNISGPRPQASVEQAPGAFERPRPPPQAVKN